MNRVEGQSCCAAAPTARLRDTEGCRRPRGIIVHMKRVGVRSLRHFFMCFWPFVHRVVREQHGQELSRSFYPLMREILFLPSVSGLAQKYPSLYFQVVWSFLGFSF